MDRYYALIAAVIALAVLIYIAFPFFERELFAKKEITDFVGTEFPHSEILKGPHFEADCEICLDGVCGNTGEPCWKATVNTSEGNMLIAVSTGKDKGIIAEQPDCPECDSCQSSAFYETEKKIIFSYNSGCNNPLPYCRQNEECRPCQSKSDCIAMTVTEDKATGGRFFEYGIIGTQFYGSYSEKGPECSLYYNSTQLFSGSGPEAECREAVISRAYCSGGSCGFE